MRRQAVVKAAKGLADSYFRAKHAKNNKGKLELYGKQGDVISDGLSFRLGDDNDPACADVLDTLSEQPQLFGISEIRTWIDFS